MAKNISEHQQKEEERIVVVGSETTKALIRVYNHKEDVELNTVHTENRKFTEVCYVKSFANALENLIVGTERGQIRVFGMPPFVYGEMAFDCFNAHLGEVVKVIASPDGRFVFSAGIDGTLFVYSVTDLANETTVMKQEVTVTSSVVTTTLQ